MINTDRRALLQRTAAMAVGTTILKPSETRGQDRPQEEFRLGIVGLDTSHAVVFTRYFNREADKDPRLKGLRITAAYPAGNPNFPLSKNRLAGFTKDVCELGVQIVGSLMELLPLVDGVLLESVDGTQHLEQARAVFAARKPLFIDKPLAASLKDVLEIAELGRKHQAPWFTASSSRFTPGYPELRQNENTGQILGCDAYSQARVAPGHPDLFWYGVHGVDLLYSLMSAGCESVRAVQTPLTEQLTGTWKNGRVGTYRAIREHTGKTGLGVTVFGTKGIVHVDKYYDYLSLVVAIADFFRDRRSPVPVDEMVEVFAFLAAAEESKRRNGNPVSLQDVMFEAKKGLQ